MTVKGDIVTLLESAKKYADIYADLAVKTHNDEKYWRRRRIVELLRGMSEKIKELSSVSAVP
jgi:hypothetical protein